MDLSVPSWVIPGTYGENLVFLADKPEITGVELLFFLYDGEIKALLDTEWKIIVAHGRRFTYTVHLPDQVKPEHGELIERFLPLARYFIVHPYPPEAAETQERLLSFWAEKYGKGDKTVFGGNPFLIENTLPGRQETLLRRLPQDTGLCMDTGHLLLEGKNPAAFFTVYQNRLGEIHLHDLDPEKAGRDGRLADHRPLDAGNGWLKELLPRLRGFPGVINLELFSWDEISRSIDVLKEFDLIP
ncbi:sugar phosphate isomerase/epimerase [Treponema sp. TIM-1]|uniref:cobamide remodeling phosphodiesterase CbiR n=1 Tax=Treponema sp. TIM-1 TaxID=2898417 RepID=UPI0039818768